MRYDAILIDADDTLFDFASSERNAIGEVISKLNITDPSAADEYSRINARYWAEFEKGNVTQPELRVLRFRDFLKTFRPDFDENEASEMYIVALSRQSILLPGAYEAVRRISEELPIAIVTNGIGMVQRGRMALSPIAPFIKALVISEEVGAPKPDPAMFNEALNRLGGIEPSRALMIGDSLSSDMAGAVAAGIDACWYNPLGKPRPDGLRLNYIIDSIEVMPEVALA